jgi:basic amino acid/polyamine antiporter, APA family
MAEEKPQLVRGLTATDTIFLVIGTVIGSGVFLKGAVMVQLVRTPLLVLAAWAVAGLLSLAGALTYAELGAMLPHAGGEYVYLRRAYGDMPSFLYGWMQFSVSSAAIIAAMGIGFATFSSAFYPLTSVWTRWNFHLFGRAMHWEFGTKQVVAVGIILLISAINCVGVAFGGLVQSGLGILKIISIAAVVFGVLFFAPNPHWSNLAASTTPGHAGGISAFGIGVLSALWAFGGWNNMPMAAGEVRDPGRNVPRALIIGMTAVVVIYCLTNLAYFLVLTPQQAAAANSTAHPYALPVATKAVESFLGSSAGKLISIAFILSTLGSLNGIVLSTARVPFAMARDGMFPARFGVISAGSKVPAWAIMIQAAWASILAVSGSYDQLTDFHLFTTWIFFGLTTAAVFVLRRKMPDAPRPYKTFGYPLVPLAFVVLTACLTVNTAYAEPIEAGAGLALVALGLPIFLYYRRRTKAPALGGVASETGSG